MTLIGCSPGGKIAAVVNGRVITVQEVENRMNGLTPAARSLFGENKGRLLDQMIVETLLLQEARRRGLERDAEVRRLLREAERQVLVGRLLELTQKERASAIGEGEISQFYESNRANFVEPESWRASHILVSDEETGRKALERIRGGEPFPQVAQEVSTDPSKTRGGDIGFFSKGQVIPEFEKAVSDLKPGQMSGVVKTSLGYHVILLAEHKAPRQRSVAEVQDQIRQILQGQQGQRQMEAYVQELRSKAQVKIRESFPGAVQAAGNESSIPGQKPAS